MKILHRITFNSNELIQAEFSRHGHEVPATGPVTIVLDEAEKGSNRLIDHARAIGAVDRVETRFTAAEINSAPWLAVLPSWHHGYPGPNSDEFGFLEFTYDGQVGCRVCGVGLRQVRPFVFKAEPKWGKRSILQLNWVFDEYFVTPELWSEVFSKFGLDCRSVQGSDGQDLERVVQLVVDGNADLMGIGSGKKICPACNQTKYLPFTRGFYPSPVNVSRPHAAKSRQFFGSGASAFQAVLFSNELVRALNARKCRGVEFHPCANDSQLAGT